MLAYQGAEALEAFYLAELPGYQDGADGVA
jgi:hypothetical protein